MKKNSLVVIGILILLFLGGNFLYSYLLPQYQETGYTTYREIPKNLKSTIISIEDRRFFYHPGIDPIAIGRAISQNIKSYLLFRSPLDNEGLGEIGKKSGNPQGASTIDQQLIKLTQQAFIRNRSQKITEQFLALNLQFHYSKKEIFVAYVNSIPFSHGIRGRKQACDIYFQKSCKLLNEAEITYLLAVSQLGTNPYKESNQEKILARAKLLCVGDSCPLLSFPNYISLSFKENPLDPRLQLFLNNIGELTAKEGQSFRQDIYSDIQSILRTTKTLRQQYNVKDCCVVMVDKNGALVSMNMCSDRSDVEAGKINLCLTPRQTGSAIKPFLYLYAMMTKGLKATDTIIDEPVHFDIGDGSLYEPKNFDLKHHGKVTLAYALGNSLNIPAIKLTHMVGVSKFFGFLKEQLSLFASGYNNNNKNHEDLGLSIGLGTYEISPYAFTRLWTLFMSKNTQFAHQSTEIINILSNPNNKVASFGQDSFLHTPGRAVKTGTSRKFIDGRVCGVHPGEELSMCIWMGNYNNEAMKGPSSEVASFVWNMITKIIE